MKLSRIFLVTFAVSGLCLTQVSPALARQSQAAAVASLESTIAAAAQSAAAKPGFATLSNAQKLAAIQAAVSEALAASGASPDQIAAALIKAVADNLISAGVAVSVVASVAPDFAQQVANAPAVQAQLRASGQSATVTASTDAAGGVSVLVSLQGASSTGGGGATTTTAPAPYDPCAGVIAAYCGS